MTSMPKCSESVFFMFGDRFESRGMNWRVWEQLMNNSLLSVVPISESRNLA